MKRIVGATCALLTLLLLAGCMPLTVNVVPNVRGLMRPEVHRPLNEAGLELGRVEYDAKAQDEPGTVVRQWPMPWTLARDGTQVSVVIAGAEPNPASLQRKGAVAHDASRHRRVRAPR